MISRVVPATVALSFALSFALAAAVVAPAGTSGPLDAGWRLWIDRDAAWQKDRLYLPGEADLARIMHEGG
jgi:hypothetical protein